MVYLYAGEGVKFIMTIHTAEDYLNLLKEYRQIVNVEGKTVDDVNTILGEVSKACRESNFKVLDY